MHVLERVPTTAAEDTDAEALHVAHVLRGRADGLIRMADDLPRLVASAFRRRAQELELAAWVAEIRAGLPVDDVRPAA